MTAFCDRNSITGREQLIPDDRIVLVLQSKLDGSITELTFAMTEIGKISYVLKRTTEAKQYKNHEIKSFYSFKLNKDNSNGGLE